ncbi:MAG: hypothetical protein FWE03_00665 [Firmicutes bacterium]|nr:hypothetical protein [Bacillota bacterium]
MYKIALVQNLSEMINYSYADLRDYFESLNQKWAENSEKDAPQRYQVKLFTGSNIEYLATELKYDMACVVFATNCFNDKQIYQEVQTPKFIEAFSYFMNSGGGCFVLNQDKLAKANSPIAFLNFHALDDELNLKQVVRQELIKEGNKPCAENAMGIASLHPSKHRNDKHTHFLLSYPNEINIENVKKQCLENKSRCGVFWNYWKNASIDNWDVVIEDRGHKEGTRPIVISSKQYHQFRIVGSTIKLDWQQNYELLDNIFIWLIEKEHSVAVLLPENNDIKDNQFEYLLQSLSADRFPHRQYIIGDKKDVRDGESQLAIRIQKNLHSGLMLHPRINLENLSKELNEIIIKKLACEELKLIQFNRQKENFYSFSVAGSSSNAHKIFSGHEPSVVTALLKKDEAGNSAYIDDSFLSTVDTLQVMTDSDNKITTANIKNLVQNVLEKTKNHDVNGSYDQTGSGATVAFLWLRAKFDTAEKAKKTKEFLLKKVDGFDEINKIITYTTMLECGFGADTDAKKEIGSLVLKLCNWLKDRPQEKFVELQFIWLVRALLHINDETLVQNVMQNIIERIQSDKKRNKEYFKDVDTAAMMLIYLIKLQNKNNFDSLNVFNFLYELVIFIQSEKKIVCKDKGILYPWNNKISSTAKCAYAWWMFDEYILNMPMDDVRLALMATQIGGGVYNTSKAAVAAAENLKLENEKIIKKNIELENTNKRLSRNRLLYEVFMSMAIILAYLTIIVMIFLSSDVLSVLREFWFLHSIILTALVIPFIRFSIRSRRKTKSMKDSDIDKSTESKK